MTEGDGSDSDSRRFKLLITLIAICVVIITGIAVSGLEEYSSDISIGFENESEMDIEDNRTTDGSVLDIDPDGGEDNDEHDSDNDQDEPRSDNGGESNDLTDVSDSPGVFDGSETDHEFPSTQGISSAESQLSGGSFNSFNPVTHFTVDNGGGGEWRVTTFDSYTGDSLSRTETTEEERTFLDGYESLSNNEEQTDTITLEESASRLPVLGDVTDVAIRSGANPNEYRFQREPDGTIVVTDIDGDVKSLPEGTQVDITRRGVEQTETRSDGEIEERYADNSDGVPSRVSETADQVIGDSDAETNEEKANTVSDWLEASYDYRVDTKPSEDDDLVEHFLFEAGGGGSEEFSTAATVLLREEGVPARTTVGYSQFDEGGEDVRAIDQRMWVEVYTGDGEWVTVNPTPEVEQQEAQEQATSGEEIAIEYGVNEEVVDRWDGNEWEVNGGGASETNQENGASSEEEITPPYDITLQPDPVPGQSVTVSVTSNGTAVPGVGVNFNGEFVGETGPRGELTTTVPFAESLTVTTVDGGETTDPLTHVGVSGGGAGSAGFLASPTSTAHVSTNNRTENGETFDLPTDISMTSDGIVMPGETTTVEFTIDGIGTPGVVVYKNGEKIGETDDNGELDIQISGERSGGDEITVRAARGEIESETTVTVAEPKVRVNTGFIALPGSTMEIEAVLVDGDNEEPLAGGVVNMYASSSTNSHVDEVQLDANGTATVQIPWSNSVTVATTLHGVETTETIGEIFYRVAGVVGVLLSILLVIVGIAYHRGVTGRSVKKKFYDVMFILARTGEKAAKKTMAVISSTAARVASWLAEIKEHVLELNIKKLIILIATAPIAVVRWIIGRVGKVVATVRQALSQDDSVTAEIDSDLGSDGAHESSSGNRTTSDRIRECWKWLAKSVIGTIGGSTKTTVEIGNAAVAKGFPERPVNRLRRAFQDVEYGFGDSESRVEDAQGAVTELQSMADEKTEEKE